VVAAERPVSILRLKPRPIRAVTGSGGVAFAGPAIAGRGYLEVVGSGGVRLASPAIAATGDYNDDELAIAVLLLAA